MLLPRYVLAPAHLTGDAFGWQLNRDGLFLDCHETFQPTFDRDVEAAMDWAEQIIGTRQDWRHSRAGGPDQWTAVHTHREAGDAVASATTDALRGLEPGTLVVAVGPGGSGKSTFAATAGLVTVLSLDSLREEIGGDAGDQAVTPAAVERQNSLLAEHLAEGIAVYLDSTNVEAPIRAGLIEQARRHGRPIVALRFLPHLDTCRARNASRPPNRQVPDDVLLWQHDLARAATPQALIAEGFTAAHDIVTPL
ncbi:ATP-binding protein [Streptomyces cyaneofuscatus]|uniref:ATP-binding protein n=1 Tax=Streptomyces cyaneofuscatus TaxID=66883 RepID=A0ABZ1F8E9_9ACTN|nr:ATP-binding protein [Streptomyces cyaneofuscatus]WSB12617.1 ATP-binding protein [Streptomyces cyaneofuscatus]WSD51167.1 ATP-binding protein [Streptomyces cyaneofuscatus]WSD51198.1 ATP-binding protein [Streptomyces cyaneofuscatus]